MFVVAVIFEILLFSYADSKLNIDYSESLTNQSSLNKCLAVHLSNKFFRSITFIYENPFKFFQLRQSLWKELLDNQKHTYVIISSTKKNLFFENQLKDFDNLVIEFTVLKELRKTILNIKRLPIWNIGTDFLVFSTEAVKHPVEVADKIFELLLEEGIIKIRVLLIDEKHLNRIKVYYYYFFQTHYKTDAFSTALLEYSCKNGKNYKTFVRHEISDAIRERFMIQTRFQPSPPFVIVENNTVNPENPGIEMLLMNTLAEQLKLKFNHSSISHTSVISTSTSIPTGNVLLNGTPTREFAELYGKKIDILFGNYFQTYERMLVFASSYSFYQHQLVWCVPRKVDQQTTPTIQKEVLMLFLLCFLLLILLIWLVNSRQKHSRKFRDFLQNIIYSSVSIFFAVSITKQPKTAFLRYLIALLILFSFLCNNIFTSSITSFLISKKSKLKYDTMKKIYDHNLTTFYTTKKFFTQVEIDGIPKELIEKRKIICHDFVNCLKHVAQGDSAFLTLKIFTQYFAPSVDISSIYCFDFLNSIPIGLITNKEFLFLEKFNKKIQDIVAAGLIHKWTRDLTTVPDWTLSSQKRRLSIGDFTYLFQMVLCGYLLSFLVFLYEIGLFSKLLSLILHSISKMSSREI
ncbi:Ionotropic receptor 108 [Diabrotica virgifera virgifera]|nr:Ionotropic receptor 108 [Diabrotica virgifera virgifera]